MSWAAATQLATCAQSDDRVGFDGLLDELGVTAHAERLWQHYRASLGREG